MNFTPEQINEIDKALKNKAQQPPKVLNPTDTKAEAAAQVRANREMAHLMHGPVKEVDFTYASNPDAYGRLTPYLRDVNEVSQDGDGFIVARTGRKRKESLQEVIARTGIGLAQLVGPGALNDDALRGFMNRAIQREVDERHIQRAVAR